MVANADLAKAQGQLDAKQAELDAAQAEYDAAMKKKQVHKTQLTLDIPPNFYLVICIYLFITLGGKPGKS